MSDQQVSPPASWYQRLPEQVATTAQVVTAIGGFAYGLGWLITSRFCSHFGIAPEEVGITFSWLAIRAFAISLLSFLVVVAGMFLLGRAHKYGPVARIIESRFSVSVAIHLVCQVICAIALLGLVAWANISDTSMPWAVVVVFFPAGLIIGILIVRMIPRDGSLQIHWDLRLWLLAMAAFLVSFVAVFLLLLPFPLGDRMAEQVESGQEIQLPILPGINAIRVEKVRLATSDVLDPKSASINSTCLMRLGSSDGTSIFFDPATKRVMRVNDQNFNLFYPCP